MTACRFEPDVIRAAASGEWTQSLRAHLDSCADCAAAAEVGPWMMDFARLDDREHILPDPAVLWLKAKLMQSNTMMHRVALPITRLQIGAYLTVAACWAALLTWKWPAIQAWVNSPAFQHGHRAHSEHGPVSSHSELWQFEVIQHEDAPAQ